ncbi:hypothetical protein FRB90_003734 [Tulasnella sp. 427]|nr:hypothetical protein FRB90_003734 [Tulasnella sp. 427]
MMNKVLVTIGLKKKMCEYCDAAPVHPGHNYCTKSCANFAKLRNTQPPARGPPKDAPRSGRGRGRERGKGTNTGGHEYHPSADKMCFTCGSRPVYKNRDYCSRSCSEGIPWNPPASAPPYPSTNNRNRDGRRDPRHEDSRNRRYSDYKPRDSYPQGRHQRNRDEDEDSLPDLPPSASQPAQGRSREAKAPEQKRNNDRRITKAKGRDEEEEEEEEEENDENAYEPPSRSDRRRAPPSPPKAQPTSSGKGKARVPSTIASGSPWPPKTPQPRPKPQGGNRYDESESDS